MDDPVPEIGFLFRKSIELMFESARALMSMFVGKFSPYRGSLS